MAGNNQEFFFGQGMDQDSDPHIKQGYDYALNIINGNTLEGDNAAIVNPKGNLKIGNPWLRPGSKEVGSCENLSNNSIIYFIYDPDGYHGIYRYYRNSAGFINGVVHKLLRVENPTAYNNIDKVNPLNFQADKLITGVDIIDNLLYWTDYHNRPRTLDMLRADNWNKKQIFNQYFNKSNFWNDNYVAGADMVTNGDFSAGGLDWYLAGTTGFTFSGGKAVKAASANTAVIQQPISAIIYTNPAKKFRVTFTLSGSNNAGGVTPVIGQTLGVAVTQDGTYTQDIFAYAPPGNPFGTNNITLSATSNWEGEIDLVSVQELTPATITHYFEIYKANSLVVYNFQFTTSADSYEQLCSDFMDYYVASQPAQAIFTAINRGQWIQMEMADTGSYIIVHREELFSDGSIVEISMSVPDNFYPDYDANIVGPNYPVLTQDLIDRIRYPEVCQPMAEFKTDITRSSNDVYQGVYQFRTRYNYIDYSRSTLSAISTIPIPSIDIENPDTKSDNYIEVDFTDPRLNDISLVSIIREVEVLFREHNTGEWRICAQLKPYQFAGTGNQTFKFYNDTNAINIPSVDAVEPFENVPIRCKSQKIIDNRLFDGGIVEGYDKPKELDANIDVVYNEGAIAAKKLYTITGRVFIRGMYGFKFQPIVIQQANPDIYTWGGWSLTTPPVLAQEISFNQEIPLGGFTFFLAGTEYYGITKQKLATNGAGQYGNGNALAALTVNDNSRVLDCLQEAGGWYHDFKITNVPEGKYIMRVASHLITYDEINTNSYQQTSTNVMSIGGVVGTEAEIILNDTTTINGVFHSGYAEIADLLPTNLLPGSTDDVCGLTGYICDQDLGAASDGSFNNNLTDSRIARSKLAMNLNGTPNINSSDTLFNNYPHIDWINGNSYADHNGYFFFASSSGSFLSPTNIYSGSTAFATWIGRLYTTNAIFNNVSTGTGQLISVRNTDTNVTDNCKTYVLANIQNITGSKIKGVAVVLSYGSFQLSDGNGNVKIPCYINTLYSANKKNVHLYIYSPSVILFLNPTYQEFVQLNVQMDSGHYNKTNNLDSGIFLFQAVSTEAKTAFKRGWDGEFGIVYFDEADRRTFVATNEALQKHINFYTEKQNGVILPAGAPDLNWQVYHRPPDWAVKWQWVRTENQNSISFLQWIADSVRYVNDNSDTNLGGNTTQGVTKCLISLTNIGYYTINKHPNSVINYTFQKGDRIRFIADETGAILQDNYDYEVLSYVAPYLAITNDISLFIKKGYFFEIYTPRSDSQVKLFYEFGECFDVGTAVINGVRQKYHKGLTQDQSFDISPVMAVTPATGTFRTGDVYYRRREMQIGCVLQTDVVPVASTQGNVVRAIIDQSISDFYSSKDQSIGRVNTDYGDTGQVERPSMIRFTDEYISNTKINGFSTERALNYKQLTTNYGLIERLMVVGNDVLKSIHHNSYLASMYINKSVIRAASGSQTIVAISDEVIAKTHDMERTFGTQHPESVVLNDEGDLFGWDERQGVMWRSSGNGMVPISEYRMRSYFKPKSIRRLNVKKQRVPAGYHLGYDLYIPTFSQANPSIGEKPKAKCLLNDNNGIPLSVKITHYPTNTALGNAVITNTDTAGAIALIINSNASGFTAIVDDDGYLIITTPSYLDVYSNSKIVITFNNAINYSFKFDVGVKPDSVETGDDAATLSFSKQSNVKNEGDGVMPNRWQTYFSFQPEGYGRLRNEIVSFVNGELWLHDSDEVPRNNFYGVQYVSQVKVTFNKDFQKVKVYKHLSQCPGEGQIDLAQRNNLLWYCPEIKCGPTQTRPNGFLSELKRGNFKHTYGNYHAEIKRNKLSPAFTDQLKALINGDFMQGETCTVTFENDSPKKVALFSVGIEYIYIEIS